MCSRYNAKVAALLSSSLVVVYLKDLGMDDQYLESFGEKLTSGIAKEYISEIDGMILRFNALSPKLSG